MIFVEISVSWHALEVSNFKISLSLECLLHTSPIASMLGLFLYFTTYFKTGFLILLARDSQFEYSVTLRLEC